MKRRALIRPQALLDIADIAMFIRENSPASARRFLRAIRKELDRIAVMPGIGSLYSEEVGSRSGLRLWPVKTFKNYLIFYFHDDKVIDVVRVVHGARDLPSILGD